MKPFHKHFVAAFGLLTVIAVTPTSAFARGSVHIDVPGFSIGVHDDHGHKYRDRRYRKKHHRKSRHYRNDNYYYDDRRYRKRYYNDRRRNERRYYNRRYNDNYYYGGRRNNRGYYNDGYYNDGYCPTAGYSRYYDRNRNCYRHKNHYHCS